MTTPTPAPQRTNELADDAVRSANDTGIGVERGAEAVRVGIHQAHDAAQRASKYIKSRPLKSLLIAGAVGAALLAVMNVVVRSRDSRLKRSAGH